MSEQEIDQLETGPEMDKQIAVLMTANPCLHPIERWERVGTDGDTDLRCSVCKSYEVSPPYYSKNISEAWTVVEKVENTKRGNQDGHPLRLQRQWWDGTWKASIGASEAEAKTAPLAICRAVLKAFRHPA